VAHPETFTINTLGFLGVRAESVLDLPGLIGAVYGLDGLIVHATDVGPDFYRLESGLAGELFQRLVHLRLPTAFVLPDWNAHGERFAQLASEHARHPQVRFVHTDEDALLWLAGQLGPDG